MQVERREDGMQVREGGVQGRSVPLHLLHCPRGQEGANLRPPFLAGEVLLVPAKPNRRGRQARAQVGEAWQVLGRFETWSMYAEVLAPPLISLT